MTQTSGSFGNLLKKHFGDDSDVAHAWRNFEDENRQNFHELRVEISKAVNRSTWSLWLAGIMLAGFVGSAFFVGLALGGVETRIADVEDRLSDVGSRLNNVNEKLDTIDQRTSTILEKQKASVVAPPGNPSWMAESGNVKKWESLIAALEITQKGDEILLRVPEEANDKAKILQELLKYKDYAAGAKN
jgi:hypothetical protein